MIGMYEFAMPLPLSVKPSADIFCPSGSICVRSCSMPLVIFPLALVRVTVDVRVFTVTASLIFYPAACRVQMFITINT